MKFPIPISEWKICDCGKGDFEVIEVTVDDKLEERFRTLLSPREQRRIIKWHKRTGHKMAKKQYILKLRCKGCGFIWDKYILDKTLEKEEFK